MIGIFLLGQKNNMKYLLFITILLYSCSNKAITEQTQDTLTKPITSKKIVPDSFLVKDFCANVIGLINKETNENENFVFDKQLYALKLDTLKQVIFWRKIMNLQADSSLVNIGHNRIIIAKIHNKEWSIKSDSLKNVYRDSVKKNYGLDTTQRILITTGKKFFYDFDKTSQNFNKGINCFIENGVDPWYAQAILLIESPNKLQKSNVGAYGPFQLMKDVARLFGLKVNRKQDERADFERSAFAASSLIKKVCIPKLHSILDSLRIENQNENELWFKLLVMHVYHAGSYNVEKALYSFMPQKGDINIIYNIWQARTARFKNASQNYSQLVLAAMMEMNDRKNLKTNPPPKKNVRVSK